MSEFKYLTIDQLDKIIVVHFKESRLSNDYPINELGRELLNILELPDQKKCIIDFSNVIYICSALLCHLIKLQRKANEKEISLKYIRTSKELKQVFKILCFNKIMAFYDTLEEAVAAFEETK